MKKNAFMKFLHKFAIDYPFASILIVTAMCTITYLICVNIKVPTYIECTVPNTGEGSLDSVTVEIDKEYYEEVSQALDVKWYFDMNEAVFDAEVKSVELADGKCVVIVSLDKNSYINSENNDSKNLTLKICNGQETALSYLKNTYK